MKVHPIRKRQLTRMIAVGLALVAVIFIINTAAHVHRDSLDDHACQVCHIAHGAPIQFSTVLEFAAPIMLGRFIPAETADELSNPIARESHPRAPPAS
jgi:hypothetical protein